MELSNIRITERAEIGERAIETVIEITRSKPAPAISVIVEGKGTPAAIAEAIAPKSAKAAHAERWTKILADGTEIPGSDSRTDHVAVFDAATGLMWAVESLGDEDDADDGIAQEHCIQRCKDLRLLGHADWTLPSRAQLAGLIDDTRHEPAIDTNLFPRVKPRWHWTSTPCAWSSASAWRVFFSYGGVYYLHRDFNGFALAVRRVGQ